MNRIDKKFRELRKDGKKAFIAYITAGDPGLDMTKKLVIALENSGVDIIELGIPFSDPMADGPTIQAASQRALENRINLKNIFGAVTTLRKKTDIPVAFMTYYNPVLKYGLERFVKDCKIYGVDGVIIPDLPCEEAKELVKLARKNGIATIFLAAPTSTRERIKKIIKCSGGFIYYVSLTGVTGPRRTLPPEVKAKVAMIKSMTRTPVAVGFGISNAKQARDISKISDAIIVGSALVKVIENNLKSASLISRVSNFAKSLAKAIHG